MPLVADPDPEAAAHRFIKHWFGLLAQNHWSEALFLLGEPTSYGQRWSKVQIQDILNAYAKAPVEVSEPDNSVGDPHWNLGHFVDGSGFWLDCNLPLNGAWSDLTAQFEFRKREDIYVVTLQDIHVL